jgi:uncharacterized protein (DUF2147 family)
MMATLTPFARAERRDKMQTARENTNAQVRADAGASSIAHRGELGALFERTFSPMTPGHAAFARAGASARR